MTQPDHIEYFKALVEQNPTAERWSTWWDHHGAEMAGLVPRSLYLRLTSPMSGTKYMAVFAVLEAAGFHYPRPDDFRHPKLYEPAPLSVEYLDKKLPLAEIQQFWTKISDYKCFAPFLQTIREDFRECDEVWTYRSRGHHGYAFVRNGVPYDHLPTVYVMRHQL